MENKVQLNGKATVTANGKTAELPVYKGTIGPDVIDIGKLYAQTGMFTLDPGFTSTASCESQITYIDGDEGILLHRGYPIDQLAEKSSFLEVCYLLLHGELPNAAQYKEFDATITRHTMLHAQFDRFFEGYRRDAHPRPGLLPQHFLAHRIHREHLPGVAVFLQVALRPGRVLGGISRGADQGNCSWREQRLRETHRLLAPL